MRCGWGYTNAPPPYPLLTVPRKWDSYPVPGPSNPVPKNHQGTPMNLSEQPTQKQVNTFLDALRDSGKTNMVGATPYIQKQFNITKYDAQRFLIKWMETFGK